LAETTENSLAGLVSEARERLKQQVSAQSEQLSRLEQTLQELREQQKKLEEAIQQQLDTLSHFEPPAAAPAAAAPEGALDKLLGSVRNLITATIPEQVLEVLTEEAEQMGVRGAVFDVRGKAAWGASARGFGQSLSEKALRGLIIPLNQENPFRQVYETGGHIDATADSLRKNRNILDKFKPAADDPILLLPIRSTGSVSAIFYADPGGNPAGLPVDGLKILAEFAGAQLDRLMALSGGMPAEAAASDSAATEVEVEAEPEEVPEEAPADASAPAEEAPAAEPQEAAQEAAAEPESAPEPPPPPAAPAGLDLSQRSEEDQKAHKDAKRFAKLLVSEIELYNKTKVADGRKNSDIYKRLKTDIERSRQTFQKRFAKTAAKEVDYFHEELVRTLAGNDAALLGSDYPGPSS
jgi:hypothetical protein